MKRILFTTIFTIYTTLLFAQSKGTSTPFMPKNNISMSLFADASLISVNYERLSYYGSYFALASKIGLGYDQEIHLLTSPSATDRRFKTVPHHITGNIGIQGLFIEFGMGGTLNELNGPGINASYILYPIIGLRVMSEKRKISFRYVLQYSIVGKYEGVWEGSNFSPGFSFGYIF